TRFEDYALLKGKGKYVGDITLPRMLESSFVRSPHPHATIKSVDASAARALPGVHAVLTYEDFMSVLATNHPPWDHKTWDFPEHSKPVVIPKDEVCFAGQAVAMVLADSRYIAEDAAALVEIDYDPLPAVSDCRDGIAVDAPTVHRDASDNIASEFYTEYGDCRAAFANAVHTFKLSLKQHRGGAHSIEARGIVAHYESHTDVLTVWASTQTAHKIRNGLVEVLGADEHRVRVIVPDVGGAFGGKNLLYPEDAMAAAASRLLERPVRWIEDRREHFVAAIQERDQYWDIEVATDAEGRILGIQGTILHDQGAYTLLGLHVPHNSAIAVPGPYVIPNYRILTRVIETNRVGAIPVRGAGYPEGNFAMERLLDEIATRLKLDRVEVRRRNLIPTDSMPYELPMKTRERTPIIYDSGDFPGCQARAVEAIGYETFRAKQIQALDEGRYIGVGIANMIKVTGRGPFESGLVRIGRSGRVMIYTGAMAMGQGTKTTLAQICSDQLGVDPGDIMVVTADTAGVPHGIGGYGSRQTVTAGNAVHLAAIEVRERVLEVAAHMLEASDKDLVLEAGEVRVRGAPSMSVKLSDIAKALSGVKGFDKPSGMKPALESTVDFMPTDVTYGNACHAVEVEVDVGTGDVELIRYVVVNDSGNLINPMIVEGQIHGGVAHGIGNALFEWMGYDENAQPVITTFADYLLPSSTEVPNIEILHHEFPSTLNPLGVKGVGEAGTIPAASAIVSAIEDALAPFGVHITQAPISPMRIIELIEQART
ncbi:MAG: xanthine dehydrogenase family protein molybdopterin-binding subunit, partial [Lysobacterales bacterium]